MVRYTEIKSGEFERRIKLEGLSVVDIVSENNNLKALTLSDKKGNIIKFQYLDYRVSLFAVAEPKFEKKWVLKGNFKGLEIKEVYDYESDAKNRKEELDDCDTLVIVNELVEVKDA